MTDNDRIVFHIDVNSAFLSWDATDRLQHGESLDLRTVRSVVGGDATKRRGIVLAKSLPCKPYGIQTGESIYSAMQKCPDLIVVPARFSVYKKASNALIELAHEYSDKIQQFSIDEFFLDYTDMENYLGDPIKLADTIRERIKKELGFTVCVGVSSNKLLAKMATELRKPNYTNTLFPNELEKMWSLPVEDLFMVGRATAPKLRMLGIKTIGDLAHFDHKTLRNHFKHHGEVIWRYANGIETSEVFAGSHGPKGIGNSTTLSRNVTSYDEAKLVMLSLSEMVGMRLRFDKSLAKVITIGLRTSEFKNYTHQKKIFIPTDITNEIFGYACQLFKEAWKGEPLRHISVHVSDLTKENIRQLTLFDSNDINKKRTADHMVDRLRNRFGDLCVTRACFLENGVKPITGGSGHEEHYMMHCEF